MTVLLDVNVLMAMSWPNQTHNAIARAWFREFSTDGWATCPITESGFVRLSSNPRVTPAAVSPTVAIDLLARLRQQPGHEFWVDDVSIATSPEAPLDRLVSHAQVTDAHLLALARRRNGRVVTFDRGLVALAGAEAAKDVVLLGGLPAPRES